MRKPLERSAMKDQDRINELNSENEELRRQVAALEKALQKNQWAAAILQIAPLGVHELDTKGRITFVNPSQEAITGYTADELVGTYAWDRIEPGPTRNSLPTYLEHLVAEQPTRLPISPRTSGRMVRFSMFGSIGTISGIRRGKLSALCLSCPTLPKRDGPKRRCGRAESGFAFSLTNLPLARS